ncbi:MAG: PD40 domain-containing protein [Burkholderiales bacterium]|nr:PD40 domain-containing protein [Phycisphaerae bacterium]
MRWIALLLFLSLSGCVQPPKSEADVFDDVVQLTSGFKAAGEAFFSADTNWIVFQAIPPAEDQYQMYLARLLRKDGRITGIGQAIRITPPDSQSSRGYFSPDGVSIILAASIGKDRDTKSPWPTTTEIYRADAWQGAIAATEFSRGINLAQHALTRNHAYDGECAISPNGQWIIFTSTRDADPARPVKTARDADLYVMRSDGSRTVRLTTTDGYDGSAIFSPDSGRIVFRADRANSGIPQLHIADLAWNAAGDITGLQHEQPVTRTPSRTSAPTGTPTAATSSTPPAPMLPPRVPRATTSSS